MTSFHKTIIISLTVLLLACCSCGSKTQQTTETTPINTEATPITSTEKSVLSIPQLQEQLSRDSIMLCEIQALYPDNIEKNFLWCDSMLQYLPENQVNEYFDILNLAQAYLVQFDEMLPVMQRTISYSRQQLDNLKNDLDTQYVSDSLAAVYLADENAVADTLHNRILYFQDRLSAQDKELQLLRKNISKAASR